MVIAAAIYCHKETDCFLGSSCAMTSMERDQSSNRTASHTRLAVKRSELLLKKQESEWELLINTNRNRNLL